jgi:2-polyprenyl-3-methyl-5-hydroxy-6-metoxy-1,4-benzoquinol methylase
VAVDRDPEQTETDALHALVDFKGKDVFEIGCGDGRLTWRYAHRAASVLAIDAKEDKVASARANTPEALRSAVTFQVADVIKLDLSRSAYDVVLVSWSL